MQILHKEGLTYDDVLLVPQHSEFNSRADVDTTSTSKCGKLTLKLPIISANMDTIYSASLAKWLHGHGALASVHRFMSERDNVSEWLNCPPETFCSLGFNDTTRLDHLYEAGCRRLILDVAHGDCKQMLKTAEFIKKFYKGVLLVGGNVATVEGTRRLIGAGVDVVKVGVGPGSHCSTRGTTGHGYAQLTAVMECVEEANKWNKSVIADGGIKRPGDLVKALAAGADFIMSGSLFAGSYYSAGLPLNGEKIYRGMASHEAMKDAGKAVGKHKTAEGVSSSVPYKNEEQSEQIIRDLVGGLRSGMTYSGSGSISELQEKAIFQKISHASFLESKTVLDK